MADLVTGENVNIGDMHMGDGWSAHHHPPDPDMEWEAYVWLRP